MIENFNKEIEKRENYIKQAKKVIGVKEEDNKGKRVSRGEEQMNSYKEYKEKLDTLKSSRDGKSESEVKTIDNNIEKLQIQQKNSRLERQQEILKKFQSKIENSTGDNKELKKGLDTFYKDSKEFSKNIDKNYESKLDKKVEQLDSEYQENEIEGADSSDLLQLMVFGQLKVMMDSLKVAENLGIKITKAYIADKYEKDLIEASKVEKMYHNIQAMEKIQGQLEEKGISVDFDIDKDELITSVKDLSNGALNELEDRDGIQDMIKDYENKKPQTEEEEEITNIFDDEEEEVEEETPTQTPPIESLDEEQEELLSNLQELSQEMTTDMDSMVQDTLDKTSMEDVVEDTIEEVSEVFDEVTR